MHEAMTQPHCSPLSSLSAGMVVARSGDLYYGSWPHTVMRR